MTPRALVLIVMLVAAIILSGCAATVTGIKLKDLVAQKQTGTLTQGTQSQVREQVAQTTHWKHYRNRVTSMATKVNLTFEEAKPLLTERLLRTLAGAL